MGGGGGVAARGASEGTSRRGRHSASPGPNTRVSASMLPAASRPCTSAAVTGPTCCPPIARYHTASLMDVLLRPPGHRRKITPVPQPDIEQLAHDLGGDVA